GTRLALLGRFNSRLHDSGVVVWDTQSGRRRTRWDGPYVSADAVTLTPDGRAVLIGAAEDLLVIEVATGGARAQCHQEGKVESAAVSPDGTKLVSSSPEAPIYVWNLLGDPGPWDPAKADAVWADLASSDAKSAYAAVRKLRANPAEAVAFLKDRVKVPVPPADETVAKWIKGLDAPAFADREKAQRELSAAAALIRPKLEPARKLASAEAGRRLDQVLKAVDEHVTAGGRRERPGGARLDGG